MRVHKITPNMVKDKVTFKEYWEEIKEIVKEVEKLLKKRQYFM